MTTSTTTVLFDWKLVFTQIPNILRYLPTTVELTLIATLIGYTLGLLLALIKINRIPVLRQISAFFISFVRGTPIILQLYITYYGIPLFLKWINRTYGTSYDMAAIPAVVFAILALGLNQSAFDSEIIRAAIQSVDKGQIEAARSMGMKGTQVLRRVILPQALTVALPSLGNSLISLIKGTSLAFTVAVVDMTAQGRILAGRNFRYFEVYVSLAIIYWILTIVLERLFKYLETRFSVPEEPPVPDEKKDKAILELVAKIQAEGGNTEDVFAVKETEAAT
jgi:polar amino acid transport system permease protein